MPFLSCRCAWWLEIDKPTRNILCGKKCVVNSDLGVWLSVSRRRAPALIAPPFARARPALCLHTRQTRVAQRQ